MREIEKSVYAEAMRAHEAAYPKLIAAKNNMPTDAEGMADVVYALKQASALFEDMRKETDKVVKFAEQLCCALWLRGDGQPIRTEYCTGSPDVKQTAQTPKPGTDEYAMFCDYFGIDPNAPFRPHWPTVLEKISQLIAEGKPLPPGCDPSKQWTIFSVSVRKKKAIDFNPSNITDPELLKARARLMLALQSMSLGEITQLGELVMRTRELGDEQEKIDNVPEGDRAQQVEPDEVNTPF